MKIGIVTLRLRINIGGLLQAFAMQSVLRDLGHEVVVISKDKNKALTYAKVVVSFPLRVIKRYLLGKKKVVVLKELKRDKNYAIISQNTQRFIDENIARKHCYSFAQLPKNCVDAIVVGSDQVWRPKYFKPNNICDAYLRFARNWDIKRVAYAASFGTDEWEYSPKQQQVCKGLISKFDAVSVREDSAVKLCQDHFDTKATHVLDPTMLLDKQRYIDLTKKANTPQSPGNLLVYVLDETSDKTAVVDAVAQHKGLTPFKVNSKVADKSLPSEQRIQPPLEKWLRGFMDAEFVVTDSFHACVFSIIFNKPFIAYINKDRGASRFSSLTKLFGLQGQVISSFDELDTAKHCAAIDWARVNCRHEELKKMSLDYLNSNLSR